MAVTSHVSAQTRDGEPEFVPATTTENITPTEESKEATAALPLRIQNRLINLSRNMESRMDAAILRIAQITGRVESRIAKLKAEGMDTSTAETMLEHSKSSLDTARGSITLVDETLINAVTSRNPYEGFRSAKRQFLITTHAIRDAHTHLRTVLELLKESEAIGVGDSEEALN